MQHSSVHKKLDECFFIHVFKVSKLMTATVNFCGSNYFKMHPLKMVDSIPSTNPQLTKMPLNDHFLKYMSLQFKSVRMKVLSNHLWSSVYIFQCTKLHSSSFVKFTATEIRDLIIKTNNIPPSIHCQWMFMKFQGWKTLKNIYPERW